MKNFKIAIIGVGNIGSRHLQGLLGSKYSLTIFIIEPNPISIENIKNFINKKIDINPNTNIIIGAELSKLPKNIDLAIVATQSRIRKKIIVTLLETVSLKYLIIEKIVFQKVDDFYEVKHLLEENQIKSWVNCPYRTYPIYIELKELINRRKLLMTVKGRDWGMGCNSIHFIDLFTYLTGEEIIEVDSSGLSNEIIKAKREGFLEFRGLLKIKGSRGSMLILEDTNKFKTKIQSSFHFENEHVQIIDKDNYINSAVSDFPINRKEKNLFPFQSEITSTYVDLIIRKKEPRLVDYENCMNYHILMVNAFNNHLSKVLDKEIIECPIT